MSGICDLRLSALIIRLLDRVKRCSLLSDYQYGFSSSQSTADLLAVVSDRITRALIGLELLEQT